MIQDVAFWLFLAATVAIYWLLPARLRLLFLSAASLAFIGYYDRFSLLILLAMSVALRVLLPAIARRDGAAGLALALAIALTALPLIGYKLLAAQGGNWFDGSLSGFAVPLGLSYYVFRMIHVAVETYRDGDFPRALQPYFTYIFLFTIFVAGPIQRYDEAFRSDLSETFQSRFLGEGAVRIAQGLIKQTLVIDLVTALRDRLLGNAIDDGLVQSLPLLNAPELWVVAFATYLIAWMNLSAYTDVAIGSSRLFGLRVMENFGFPLGARSLTDFWRRWHISLSSWCQSYVYSPVLGATRNPYVALIASFQVMGLWHLFTLNRVAWGLFQASGVIALSLFRARTRKQRQRLNQSFPWAIAGWLVTQAFVAASFIFVLDENSSDVPSSVLLILRMISFGLI